MTRNDGGRGAALTEPTPIDSYIIGADAWEVSDWRTRSMVSTL